MKAKGQILGTYSVKIAIALLLLIVGGFLYLRADLSRNRAYSLSRQTKEQLRNQKERVVVKVFASQGLPPEFSSLNRSLKDLLAEFQRLSRGKLVYEYVRAKSNEDLIQQAQEYNLPPYMVITSEDDRQVSKQVVLGLSFESGGKTSALPLKPGMESLLEYQLYKHLNKLRKESLPEILVFADSLSLMFQYRSNPDELATFFLELMDNYRMTRTDLQTEPEFAPVMLCLGVIDSLSTQQIYNLDQYLMRGGKLVLCQDRVGLYTSPQGSALFEIKSNLFDLLEHYGVRVLPNVVLDRECEIRQGAGLGSQTPYPFFPLISPNPRYPYTQGFGRLYLYFASQVDSVPQAQLKLEPVLRTSAGSNVLVGPEYQVEEAIQRGLDPRYLNQPPKTVAAEYSGRLRSYFTEALPGRKLITTSPATRIIIFGDSELPLDFGAGAYIVLNSIDHLLNRPQLLKLRSPRQSDNPLGPGIYMNKRKIMVADPERVAKQLAQSFKTIAVLLPLALLFLLVVVQASRRKKAYSG